ncbi:MAG: YHYH protein [Candidatus Kapabacteria bacterium]|nr:YHYH protein [Candidatus Kapabacteria bacterium]
MRYVATLFTLLLTCITMHAQPTHPAITSWMLNTTGITGRHYVRGNPTPIVDTAKANCQLVQYSDNNAYVRCNGIPAYVIGPYLDGNPSTAVGRNYLFRIPLKPQVNSGVKTVVGLGHVAVLINGVPIYNYADARSYNNANIWHQNAIVFERAGFDCAKGHPAPIQTGPPGPGGGTQGQYHHHQDPSAFNIAKVKMSDVCDMYLADGLYVPDSTKHGPLIGFSFDGYPIYGAYGWVEVGGQRVVKRITPGYRLRSITDRTTLADGTKLTAAQYGPSIAQAALGSYAEDYEFVEGLGDLDVHNGRFCVTPEYPDGTYAYFATIDADGNSVYPYVIGPTYYGVVATDNFAVPGPGSTSTNVKITEQVTTYVPNTNTTDPSVTITSTAVLNGKADSPYTYTVTAEANVKETVSFALLAAPQGMTIDATTGVITWQKPVAGTHTVTVQASIVSAGKQYKATQTFSLVIESNDPLTITFRSDPALIGYEGSAYSYRVRARASDTTKRVTFRLADGAPSGMTLAMGTISWPSPVKGQYPITIVATIQGDTVTAQQSYTLEIKADTTTSVDERSALSTVTIFPNPAADILVVQVTTPMTESASVELVDAAGRVVRRATINQGSTMCFIDVQSMYAGAYIARITRKGDSVHLPVVISE